MPNPQQRIKPLLYHFCLKPKAFIISCTDVLICRPDLKKNKPKMAYSRDLPKMAVMDDHGLSQTLIDYQ